MAPRSAHRNMETLAHEGTHQLTFNTGLLNRHGDVPLAIVEGFGTYGEARKTTGSSEYGRKNLKRMEDLARIQRRIPGFRPRIAEQGQRPPRGNSARIMLGYAQSWLLVHYFMSEPGGAAPVSRLPEDHCPANQGGRSPA